MADEKYFNFEKYLKEDLENTAGLRFPAKASWWEQLTIKKLSPWKLHANVTDAFCSPEVGPSYPIIQKYVETIRHNQRYEQPVFSEPVIIEKMRPNGYLLLNGHHRWAAALKTNVRKIPVKLVNMTHAADIVKLLERSDSDMRVAINLDDVVFCTDESEPAEKALPFPASRFFKERIRLGIPALSHTLHKMGYDVWVYTSGYSSTDYISRLFRHYHIHTDGIANGVQRLQTEINAAPQKEREMMEKKYRLTLHIDTDSVVRIHTGTKEFEQEMIESHDGKWSSRVISIVSGFRE